jgi:two-component system nitrate/nitrite response regulator NarL
VGQLDFFPTHTNYRRPETRMDIDLRASPDPSPVSASGELLILSDIRFVREGLAEVMQRDGAFRRVTVAVDVEQACRFIGNSGPRIILVDAALPQGPSAVWQLRDCARNSKIIAFALAETESEVIAWARAGICGYIPRTTPLSGLVEMLHDIDRGEQVCPTRIAASMLRWIGENSTHTESPGHAGGHASLTAREHEVAHLIGTGLSNKEIARYLGISVATTKSHVHSILVKLGIARRVFAVRQLSIGLRTTQDAQLTR